MADYIDRGKIRDEACNGCTRRIGKDGCGWPQPCNRLLGALISAEPEDVVPVVRCGKCIYWHDWGACGHPDNGFDAPPMGPNDFCSKGRTENELK